MQLEILSKSMLLTARRTLFARQAGRRLVPTRSSSWSTRCRTAGGVPRIVPDALVANRRCRHLSSASTTFVDIGGVKRELPETLTEGQQEKVPTGYLDDLLETDSSVLSHLQWMLRKDRLKQDTLLVGESGSVHRRRLALSYAELTQRPVEVLVLSNDTTESDLKQRRKLIRNIHDHSDIEFEDQAPVRAAINGHLLILDGLQYAERNVLPTLNNLLENRELPLEDGRLLVSPERYQYLEKQELLSANQQLIPVHPDFRVLALMTLDQTSQTNKVVLLDPPVRSRFQIRRVDPPNFHQDKELAIVARSMQKNSSIPFPVTTALPTLQRLGELFPNQRDVYLRAFPYANREPRWETCLSRWPEAVQARDTFERMEDEGLLPYPTNKALQKTYTVQNVEAIGSQPRVRVRFEASAGSSTLFDHVVGEEKLVQVALPSGGKLSSATSSSRDFVTTDDSDDILASMVQQHAVGRDLLLVSPKGEGKSAFAEQFASILGYDVHLFPLYKDMTALDLLLRRTDSGWKESPLLRAARAGQICILDGVDKLSRDTLASLQGFLTDREVFLPDGTRFAKSVHPSFRVVALASFSLGEGSSRRAPPPKWLTEEVTSMFATIVLPAPSRGDLKDILQPHNTYSSAEFEKLLDFHTELLQVADECGLTPLSTRTLLRLVKRGGTSAGNLHDNICASLLSELLRPTQRASLESVLRSCSITSPGAVGQSKKKKGRRDVQARTLDMKVDNDKVCIGDFTMERKEAKRAELVPNPFFFDIPNHVQMIQTLLSEWSVGERAFLLLGNQGTGKNKIVDRVCELANFEREYMQLHRDSTIGQLTLSPSLKGGKIVWKDSPLVRAVTEGRALVIDEADKAPLEVVAVLKSLVEDGELLLADGRRILRSCPKDESDSIPIHPDFSVWVLANRPGRLFHGNDFFAEIGDVFSAHVVPNPDLESEIRLLQSYAPNVDESLLRRVAASFDELRSLFEHNELTYPYSTREAVAVAKHLEQFPGDDVVTVLHNVLDMDSFDENIYGTIVEVFQTHGFDFQNYSAWKRAVEFMQGASGLKIEYTTDRSEEGTSSPPGLSSPKIGKWDDKNEAHVGGNQWAGGTGGSDTAGLGGRGGPYRLDRGHRVHQVSDQAKAEVSEEARAAARRIAKKALEDRLAEIGMSESEHESYDNFLTPIKSDIANLRTALQGLDFKVSERDWIKRQLDGELDDSRLVEGIAGEKHVYKRRGTVDPAHSSTHSNTRKRLRFVVDCSGSMYRFNGYDQRLERCLQAATLVMESFDGLEDKFDYSIVGHSGDSRCISLVRFGDPPSNAKERLSVLQTMVAHSQFCQSGDNTLGAIRQAVSDVSHHDAVESGNDAGSNTAVVIAISDANLERYGIRPQELNRAMRATQGHTDVKAFCVFIASFGDEAEEIRQELPLGRGFVCMDASELPAIVRNILTVELD